MNDETRAHGPGPGKRGLPATADASILATGNDDAHDDAFWHPSTYSMTHAELAAHIRALRRAGWQSWEIRQVFWGETT